MADIRKELVEILEGAKNKREIWCTARLYCSELTADYIIANGVKIPVLCKNCKNFGRNLENETFCRCRNGLDNPKEDDFCSYGERRTDV